MRESGSSMPNVRCFNLLTAAELRVSKFKNSDEADFGRKRGAFERFDQRQGGEANWLSDIGDENNQLDAEPPLLHAPWGGSFGYGDTNGTSSDRSAGRAVNGDRIDLRSSFCVKETGHLAPTPMFPSPSADGEQHRQEVAASSGEHILISWRTGGVAAFLQQSIVGQGGKSPGQHCRRDT